MIYKIVMCREEYMNVNIMGNEKDFTFYEFIEGDSKFNAVFHFLRARKHIPVIYSIEKVYSTLVGT